MLTVRSIWRNTHSYFYKLKYPHDTRKKVDSRHNGVSFLVQQVCSFNRRRITITAKQWVIITITISQWVIIWKGRRYVYGLLEERVWEEIACQSVAPDWEQNSHMDHLNLSHNSLYRQHANEIAAVNKDAVAVWAMCVWTVVAWAYRITAWPWWD